MKAIDPIINNPRVIFLNLLVTTFDLLLINFLDRNFFNKNIIRKKTATAPPTPKAIIPKKSVNFLYDLIYSSLKVKYLGKYSKSFLKADFRSSLS